MGSIEDVWHPTSQQLALSKNIFENLEPQIAGNGVFRVLLTLIFGLSDPFSSTSYPDLPNEIAICKFLGGDEQPPKRPNLPRSYASKNNEKLVWDCEKDDLALVLLPASHGQVTFPHKHLKKTCTPSDPLWGGLRGCTHPCIPLPKKSPRGGTEGHAEGVHIFFKCWGKVTLPWLAGNRTSARSSFSQSQS